MASYEQRPNRAGVPSHRVRFRLDGKNRAETFATEVKARQWLDLINLVGVGKALAALDAPDDDRHGRTVAEQVANHIGHLTGVTEGTRARYADYLRRRIDTHPLGATPLHALTRDDCATWVNWLTTEGLAAKTIKNHHSLLSASLTSAVRDQLIATNHAEGIRIATPEDESDEMIALSLPELWAFIDAAPPHWRPLVLFLFGTGVRFGEASALRIGDVDLIAGQARVLRAWKHTNGHGHQLGQPKSNKKRTIVFGRDVAAAIAPLIADRPAGSFLFTNTRGGPVRRTNFAEQGWGAAVHVFAGDIKTVTPTAGRHHVDWTDGPGRRPTPHDARHTYASLQILRGASMAFLQRQMGHASIVTTLGVYGHFQTEDLRALADVIDVAPLELEI